MELSKELPPKEEVAVPAVAFNVNIPATIEKNEIVEAEEIVSMRQNVIKTLEIENDELNQAYNNFSEMVFNAGDATSASKEALVNLLKLKSDLIDKKMKMMEIMLKAYQKDGPKNVTAHQHNDFHIGGDKRKLFADLDKEDKK